MVVTLMNVPALFGWCVGQATLPILVTAGPILNPVYLFSKLYCIFASLNSSTEIRVVGEGRCLRGLWLGHLGKSPTRERYVSDQNCLEFNLA